MEQMKSFKRKWRTVLFPLFTVVLVFSMIAPTATFAANIAGEEIGLKIETKVHDTQSNSTTLATITEDLINTNSTDINNYNLLVELTLTEADKEWADDFINGKTAGVKKDVLLKGLKANFSENDWNSYKEGITYDFSSDKKTLILELPRLDNALKEYEIEKNQTISINLSPVLIEDWPGTVQPMEFTIYAKPRISLGGTIVKDTTLENIQKGGKTIELSLTNAKWNQVDLKKVKHFNQLLNGFKNTETTPKVWDMAILLKDTDPNKVISFSDDERTLSIKLPANQDAVFPANPDATKNGVVTFELGNNPSVLYTVDSVQPNAPAESNFGLNGTLIDAKILDFTIDPPGITSLTATLDNPREVDIKSAPATLTLELTNAEWAVDSNAKKQVLIDSLAAKDQPEEWEKINKSLSVGNVGTPTDNDTKIKITIPQTADYSLAKDQTISLKVPHQLLKNDVKLPEAKFIITAQPKVLITGNATTISPTDFAQGGKMLTLTLVNAVWDSKVATDTVKRERLIDAFTWDGLAAPTPIKDAINAKGIVKRSNDKTVTITLPAISTKKSGDIEFKPNTISSLHTAITSAGNLVDTPATAITIEQAVTPKPTVTGTILDNTTEFDIAIGRKTIILTLKNDIWAPTVDKNKISISGDIGIESFTRNSDTTATLILDEKNGFFLLKDSNYDITIKPDNLMVSTSDVEIENAFSVAAVTASLSGTAIGGMDAQDVQKGGKTVIITLKNAEFDPSKNPDYKDIFGSNSPWIGTINDVKISKNKMTIKLPAVPTFSSGNDLNVNVPYDFIMGAPATGSKIAGVLNLGTEASVTVNNSTFEERQFQKGTGTLSFTLSNAADWDTNIETVKSKKTALLKGLSVTDQTKEWSLVNSSIAEQGIFKVSGKTLSITIPATLGYSIVRDQVVDVTIPKSVLTNYKYDIKGTSILIKIPEIDEGNLKSFGEELGNLTDMIADNGLESIRVQVPEKKIHQITTNATIVNGKTISTIEVITSTDVETVKATLSPGNGEIELSKDGTNTFIFVFDDVHEDSTLEIMALDSSGTELEKVYKKIAKGKKVYTEIPKNRLYGSYSLYTILTDKSLLTNILKYYTLDDLKIGITN